MARTAIALTPMVAAGLVLEDIDAAPSVFADGASFPWGPRRHVYVHNADSVTLTVTAVTPATVGSQALAVADATFTVAAGASRLLPVLGDEYRRPDDGLVYLNFSGSDEAVTLAVIDLGTSS